MDRGVGDGHEHNRIGTYGCSKEKGFDNSLVLLFSSSLLFFSSVWSTKGRKGRGLGRINHLELAESLNRHTVCGNGLVGTSVS